MQDSALLPLNTQLEIARKSGYELWLSSCYLDASDPKVNIINVSRRKLPDDQIPRNIIEVVYHGSLRSYVQELSDKGNELTGRCFVGQVAYNPTRFVVQYRDKEPKWWRLDRRSDWKRWIDDLSQQLYRLKTW